MKRIVLSAAAFLIVIVGNGLMAREADAAPLPPSTAISGEGDALVQLFPALTNIVIADLFSLNNFQADRRIRTVSTGRILVSAEVALRSDTVDSVECELLINDGTGPSTGLIPMGRPTFISGVSSEVPIPLVGYATKPAGTYNVQVVCRSDIGTAGGLLLNMVVWQAAS